MLLTKQPWICITADDCLQAVKAVQSSSFHTDGCHIARGNCTSAISEFCFNRKRVDSASLEQQFLPWKVLFTTSQHKGVFTVARLCRCWLAAIFRLMEVVKTCSWGIGSSRGIWGALAIRVIVVVCFCCCAMLETTISLLYKACRLQVLD